MFSLRVIQSQNSDSNKHLISKFRAYLQLFKFCLPIPVAERSKAWVCSRSPAEIAGSNPARGMDVCLLCGCQVEVSATG